ncbi:hypothetical protein KX816_10355 [Sphingosinicellaceae bacterium]|nr:hypothetical protein KX816_10355 [Sphingosinicellaceae bacterium]
MAQNEYDYCSRRAQQERVLVREASNPVVAAAHGELAAAYAERLARLSTTGNGSSRPD